MRAGLPSVQVEGFNHRKLATSASGCPRLAAGESEAASASGRPPQDVSNFKAESTRRDTFSQVSGIPDQA